MKNDTPLNLRVPKDFRDRLDKVARSRGLSRAAYIKDRMEDIIRADLLDLRKWMEEKDQVTA
jgi:predicted DNA-binding protein